VVRGLIVFSSLQLRPVASEISDMVFISGFVLRLLPPVSIIARETIFPVRADGVFAFYSGLKFAYRFRSDISCGGTQSGSAATVTLNEIVCNDWFGGMVFISGSRDIHTRGFGFFSG
jgi:hypothetical protein